MDNSQWFDSEKLRKEIGELYLKIKRCSKDTNVTESEYIKNLETATSEKDIKDMNKNVLGVLKKMANNHNVRKTEIWMEYEMQMVSILKRSRRKQKVDDHFKNARMVNDFCTGIHSWVSGFSNL